MKHITVNNFALLIVLTIAALMVTGCSDGNKASFETQEQMRKIAIDNASYNAKQFQMRNPLYAGWGLISDGDSTIGPDCPQGDGWATLFLIDPNDQKKRQKIKCSTVSGSIACLEAEKFAKKRYASEENTCNRTISIPLKKIVK